MNRPPKAYQVPLRALWLSNADVIEIRVAASRRPSRARVLHRTVQVHLDANQRMLGVGLVDHKHIGLGRWLRQNWAEASHTLGDPIPAGTVLYDEAAQVAYLSVWPNLGDPNLIDQVQRQAELYLDADGNLEAICMAVRSRRRREGDLSMASGYLATR